MVEAMAVSRGRILRVIFGLFFLGLFAWMTWEAFFGYGDRNPSAASFPKAILIPAVILGAIAVFREVTRPLQPRSSEELAEIAAAPVEFEFEGEAEIEPEVERRRTLVIVGWILGFFVGIWLIGWMVTMLLGPLLYITRAGRMRLDIAIACVLLTWLLFGGFLDGFWNIPLSERLDGILMKRFESAVFEIGDPIAEGAAVVVESIWPLALIGVGFLAYLFVNLNGPAKAAVDRVTGQLVAKVRREAVKSRTSRRWGSVVGLLGQSIDVQADITLVS